jgi:phosphatidylinositol alpha-1,6-mannosyltransferase
MTALEALASGVPVVTTPVAGMSRLLASGAGLIAANFTPEALAGPVLELLADRDRRRQMGRVGRELVRREHGLEAMVSRYATLLDRLAGSRATG